ncbi:GNAT family N-acetyltransferase [Cohnella nanjingensis]|uniref:GNAT family N-acetyltransferase n=1 Tax=Cohnella nanjingensis TaxID=1387779 RepID=A0A7X0RU78_9BACL|nr:GNAT family N-acetyltransferase [Cohnella nanjingensis]MBB6673685.1 GNAT family N-acetyltransferase [Cohnella nanjingensis]
MADIALRPVTRDNWLEAIALKGSEDQQAFVPSVAVSLAKVYIKPDGERVEYLPFAVYAGETMVGFVMHAFEPGTSDSYWINGFLIDAAHQRRGYGTAAMDRMIAFIRERAPACREIRLTVHLDNAAAERLYARFGFRRTGQIWGDERVMSLREDEPALASGIGPRE